MIADIVILTIVFGYAGFAFYRGIRKRKQGACATCAQKQSCAAASCCDAASSLSKQPPAR